MHDSRTEDVLKIGKLKLASQLNHFLKNASFNNLNNLKPMNFIS